LNVPDAVGVPLMVIVFEANEAVTPAGKPVATPMPVAPVVVCVIGVSAVLIQSVGEDEAVLTVLFGSTVIVNVCGGPVQPLAVGTTVIVATTGVFPEFVATNAPISPLPLAASPIDVLLFVQLKVVPLTEPEKVTVVVDELLHTDWSGGSLTVGSR